VLARRDLDQDRIRTRGYGCGGRKTGRYALVLSFAGRRQSLDDSWPSAPADAAGFYPAAVPLRALVMTGTTPSRTALRWSTIAGLLAEYATGSARTLVDSWPAVLEATRPLPLPARGDRGVVPGQHCLPTANGHALRCTGRGRLLAAVRRSRAGGR